MAGLLGTANGGVLCWSWIRLTLPLKTGWVLAYSLPTGAVMGTLLLPVLCAGAAGFVPAQRAATPSVRETGLLGRA